MKRYLLFKGDSHYPSGGWKDLYGSFDSISGALKELGGVEWWHIVDTRTGKIVRQGGIDE